MGDKAGWSPKKVRDWKSKEKARMAEKDVMAELDREWQRKREWQ